MAPRDVSSQCRSRAGSPTASADHPTIALTASPSTRIESAVRAPLTTVGRKRQSDSSSVACSQRRRMAAGRWPVSAARPIRSTTPSCASSADSRGSPASPTNPLGSACTAAIAVPTAAASAGCSVSSSARAHRAGQELGHDRPGAVDGRLAHEPGHGEGQARADAGRHRTDRDEVGGLLRLGVLRAGSTDDEAASVDASAARRRRSPRGCGACASWPRVPRVRAPPPWPTRLE